MQCELLVCFFPFVTALHSEIEHFTFPKMFILVSTLMTWAKTKPVDPVSAVPRRYTSFYTFTSYILLLQVTITITDYILPNFTS